MRQCWDISDGMIIFLSSREQPETTFFGKNRLLHISVNLHSALTTMQSQSKLVTNEDINMSRSYFYTAIYFIGSSVGHCNV